MLKIIHMTTIKEKQKDLEMVLQMYPQLSLLQRTILLNIFYWQETQGYYCYYKTTLEKEYAELHSPKEIKEAIDELIRDEWINKERKLVTYNERYSTQIRLTLNI